MSDEQDKAIIARVARELEEAGGTCRFCGCHGDTCSLPEGGRCVWADRFRMTGSAPACQGSGGQGKEQAQVGSAAKVPEGSIAMTLRANAMDEGLGVTGLIRLKACEGGCGEPVHPLDRFCTECGLLFVQLETPAAA